MELAVKTQKNLTKLQSLCNTVNRRYASGLNDDDQVGRMFKFEKQINDARVVIGWDKYQAISVAELQELIKDAEILKHKNGREYFEFNLVQNGIYKGRYKCNLPILNK